MAEIKVLVEVLNDETGITGIRIPKPTIYAKPEDYVSFKFSASNKEFFNTDQINAVEVEYPDGDLSSSVPLNDFLKEKGKYKKYIVPENDVEIYIGSENSKPIDRLLIKVDK